MRMPLWVHVTREEFASKTITICIWGKHGQGSGGARALCILEIFCCCPLQNRNVKGLNRPKWVLVQNHLYIKIIPLQGLFHSNLTYFHMKDLTERDKVTRKRPTTFFFHKNTAFRVRLKIFNNYSMSARWICDVIIQLSYTVRIPIF